MDDKGVAVPTKSAGTPSISVTRMRPPPTEAAFRTRVRPALLFKVSKKKNSYRVGGTELHRMDGELHAGLLGQREAVGQAGVVRAEAQQTRHQRRSVPWPEPVSAKEPWR